jgi:hypothetical protein
VPGRLHDALLACTINALSDFVIQAKLEIPDLGMRFFVRRDTSALFD